MEHVEHGVFHSMGIPIHTTFVDISKDKAEYYTQKAKSIFDIWDKRCSRFRKDSELFLLNEKRGQWYTVSQELFAVISDCVQLAEETGGLFDPSVGTYLAATGYGLPQKFSLPKYVATFRDIELDITRCRIRCYKDQILEPAGIVKGRAIDDAVHIFNDVSGWMLNAGGDIRTHGNFISGSDWHVAIQHPDKLDAIVAVISVHDQSVATSGTYQTTWNFHHELWQHQIDMRQGRPTAGLKSVSVVVNTAEEADIATSIALLYGLDRGQIFLKEKEIPYLMIDDLTIRHSSLSFDALEIGQ